MCIDAFLIATRHIHGVLRNYKIKILIIVLCFLKSIPKGYAITSRLKSNLDTILVELNNVDCHYLQGIWRGGLEKVGPAGFEPATKRIQAQIQFGYDFTLI